MKSNHKTNYMKTIEINYTRKVTFNKIIVVNEKLAKRILALDGEDLMQSNNTVFGEDGCSDDFTLIAEELTDMTDVLDAHNEIENVSISIYKPKKQQLKKSK